MPNTGWYYAYIQFNPKSTTALSKAIIGTAGQNFYNTGKGNADSYSICNLGILLVLSKNDVVYFTTQNAVDGDANYNHFGIFQV